MYDFRARDASPEEKAKADLIMAQVDYQQMKTDLDYRVGLAEVELKQQTATARVDAENKAIINESNAKAQAIAAVGVSVSAILYGVAAGVTIVSVAGAIGLIVYVTICLYVKYLRAPAESRALTVQGYYNNTRVTLVFFRDEENRWSVIDPLDGSRGKVADSRGAEALRVHMLQLAIQQAHHEHGDGVLARLWKFLFRTIKPVRVSASIVPAEVR